MKYTFVILAYKESDFLESCINSVLEQTYPCEVVIATSTPNDYIERYANKYNLKVFVNKSSEGIGDDFDFAWKCVHSDLVTVAHQDDLYDKTYAQEIVKRYNQSQSATIVFSDYYEIKRNAKELTNLNLKIKRILLYPLRSKRLSKRVFIRRRILSFGNAICCPAVTYVSQNIPYQRLFDSSMKSNVDWHAWEKLSSVKHSSFGYVSKKLMGHRIHTASTTTEIINDNTRTQEDLKMFERFWPSWIAKVLNKLFVNAEKNNQV